MHAFYEANAYKSVFETDSILINYFSKEKMVLSSNRSAFLTILSITKFPYHSVKNATISLNLIV